MAQKKLKTRKQKAQKGGWSKEDPEFAVVIERLRDKPEALIGKEVHGALTALGVRVPPADPPDYNKMLSYTSPYNRPPEEPTSAEFRNLLLDSVPRIDNEDYSVTKFTVIQPGTLVYRRQKTDDFSSEITTRYFNYSGRTDPGELEGARISLLKEPQPPLTQEYYTGTVREFGSYLFTIRVKEPLLILHIPDSIPSAYEGRIRKYFGAFGAEYLPFIDGYTLDLLQWNPNEIYKDLPSLRGFRELVVRNAARKMEIVSVIQDPPVPITAPLAAPVVAPPPPRYVEPPRRHFTAVEELNENNSHGYLIPPSEYGIHTMNNTIAQLRNGKIVRGVLTPDDGYKIEGTGEYILERNIVKLWSPMEPMEPMEPLEGGSRSKITRKYKLFSRKPKKSVRRKRRIGLS